MIEFTIDGKPVKAGPGEMILTVARREGIGIPALCQHDAVEPAGACRLCTVEIAKEGWGSGTRLVTSCLYPVEQGLVVRTRSEKVLRVRRLLLELLLARTPGSSVIRSLALEHGVSESRFAADRSGDACILCDVCTRVCQTLVTGAISRVNRGALKKVDTPHGEPSDVCVGCLACAKCCPTQAIPYADDGRQRTIWGRTFPLVPCRVCGAGTTTEAHARFTAARTGLPVDEFYVCDACRLRRTGEAMERIVW